MITNLACGGVHFAITNGEGTGLVPRINLRTLSRLQLLCSCNRAAIARVQHDSKRPRIYSLVPFASPVKCIDANAYMIVMHNTPHLFYHHDGQTSCFENLLYDSNTLVREEKGTSIPL